MLFDDGERAPPGGSTLAMARVAVTDASMTASAWLSGGCDWGAR